MKTHQNAVAQPVKPDFKPGAETRERIAPHRPRTRPHPPRTMSSSKCACVIILSLSLFSITRSATKVTPHFLLTSFDTWIIRRTEGEVSVVPIFQVFDGLGYSPR